MNKAWLHTKPGRLTGTAAGPMTAAEAAEYAHGWADQRLAGDLTHPVHESTLVHMTDLGPATRPCHCLGCLHGVHCSGRSCREGCPR